MFFYGDRPPTKGDIRQREMSDERKTHRSPVFLSSKRRLTPGPFNLRRHNTGLYECESFVVPSSGLLCEEIDIEKG